MCKFLRIFFNCLKTVQFSLKEFRSELYSTTANIIRIVILLLTSALVENFVKNSCFDVFVTFRGIHFAKISE